MSKWYVVNVDELEEIGLEIQLRTRNLRFYVVEDDPILKLRAYQDALREIAKGHWDAHGAQSDLARKALEA